MSIATISSYLKLHERLIAIVIGAALIYAAYGKVESVIAAHDAANLRQAQVILATQVSKDNATATQAAQEAQQYQALAAQVQVQNAALVSANAALATALTKQQKTDAALPPTELVTRLNTLVPNAGASITNGQVAMPQAGAVAVTQQLELVPVQQQELVNAQKETANDLSLLTASNGQVATLNSEVSGLRLENTDEKTLCIQQIKVVKDEAAKSKRRWFLIGLVSGFIGRSALIK